MSDDGGLRLRLIRPSTSLVSYCQNSRGWFRFAKIYHDERRPVAKSRKEIRPCLRASGQRIALIPLLSPPSHRGRWRAEKALAWTGRRLTRCREPGHETSRPRLAARQRGILGLRLNRRSGHARSSLSLAGVSR